MLNQVAVEALYSATYVENYLDAVENLPDEIQRYITRIREIDVKHRSMYCTYIRLIDLNRNILMGFLFHLGYLRDVDVFYEQWANCSTSDLESTNATKRNRAMTRIQQSLIAAQELGDEKLQIVQQLTDLIESKTRQLDQNFKNLDYGKDEPLSDTPIKEARSVSPVVTSPTIASTAVAPVFPAVTSTVPTTSSTSSTTTTLQANNGSQQERSNKRARRARQDTGSGMDVEGSDNNMKVETSSTKASTSSQNNNSNKQKTTNNKNNKKKRTSKSSGRQSAGQNSSRDARDDTPPPEETIDPDEPTYCLCDQISFGEMILCDNDLCPIEWFHFSCVSLLTKPKGKWYCPNCRGDRPNVMKPKAQFLKELERYNKEKEEKT